MRIDFHASGQPTIGVEWEFGLVDRTTRDLRNDAEDLFAAARPRLTNPDALHPELLRNTVEIVTGICADVPAAMEDLRRTVRAVLPVADKLGLDLYGAGMHPFASWTQQELTEGYRYAELINRTQFWGRQMLIWGVHVHVGLAERSRAMATQTALLRYYPHFQALSASSPIWGGVDTGYASNRALMFQQLPTAGLPFHFTEWGEFESYVSDLLTTGVIDDISEVRWDLRPAPKLGTLENRVCDGVSSPNDLAGLIALCQCLVVDLDRQVAAGTAPRPMPPWHVQENKWRAARYGLDAIVIVNAEADERLVTDDLADEIERLTPLAEELGCAAELTSLHQLIERGASYQRQRALLGSAEPTQDDLVGLVDSVVRELTDEIDADAGSPR